MFYLLAFFLSTPGFAADPAIPARQELVGFTAPASSSVPVVFLDADQTVRISTTHWRAPRSASEVQILPGVKEKVAELTRQGYLVAIVSNQENAVADSGYAKVEEAMQETVRQIDAGGGMVNYYDFSTVAGDAKPSPAMFQRLEKTLQARFGRSTTINRARSLMVGDSAYIKPSADFPGQLRPDGTMGLDTADFDRRFAENSGIPFAEPQDFFGWDALGIRRFESGDDLTALRAATPRPARPPVECAAAFSLLKAR